MHNISIKIAFHLLDWNTMPDVERVQSKYHVRLQRYMDTYYNRHVSSAGVAFSDTKFNRN